MTSLAITKLAMDKSSARLGDNAMRLEEYQAPTMVFISVNEADILTAKSSTDGDHGDTDPGWGPIVGSVGEEY